MLEKGKRRWGNVRRVAGDGTVTVSGQVNRSNWGVKPKDRRLALKEDDEQLSE